MWKAFSRSVCEVVERRVGFTAFRSDVSNRNGSDAPKPHNTPRKGQMSCFIPQLKTYCPLKHLRSTRYKQTSHEQSGERHQQKSRHHARWYDPPITVCLGAMGWSTALVLGWYLSQPLGRRIFGENYIRELRLHSGPYYFTLDGTVHAQTPIQPLSIHPLKYTSSIDEGSSSNSFRSSFTSSSGEEHEPFTHRRGPFTPEEALDEASRVFEAASHAFSGDVENKLGVVCMTRGQHSEAMKHFRRASHHENAVAAYNLGQCYELGLGTARNLKKAAKWYKIGSDRGHPTAMYNLAVFLANGWGGLSEDQNRAHELLKVAARLGLREAKDALKSIDEIVYGSNSQHSADEYDGSINSTDEFLELIGVSKREGSSPSKSQHSQKQRYLSRLDWLDLSSSSSTPASSEDIFNSREGSLLYSGLSLEDSCSHSSSSNKVFEIRKGNDYPLYYVVDSSEPCSAGGESLDEAATCRL